MQPGECQLARVRGRVVRVRVMGVRIREEPGGDVATEGEVGVEVGGDSTHLSN